MAREIGWLIEPKGVGDPAYYGLTDEGVLGITRDQTKAIRFARQIDADLVAQDIGWNNYIVAEHAWGF